MRSIIKGVIRWDEEQLLFDRGAGKPSQLGRAAFEPNELPERFDGDVPARADLTPQGLRNVEIIGAVNLDPPVIVPAGQFHNPYSFVPTATRPTSGPLSDAEPPDRGRFHPTLHYGRITVELTAVTPLIVPDMAQATWNDGHATVPLLKDATGAPVLPPTSLKGMIRSAFEAITDSRFGVFKGHDKRLGYRPAARANAIPARVTVAEDPQGNKYISRVELFTGTRGWPMVNDGQPPSMPAAWIHNQQAPGDGARIAFQLGPPQRINHGAFGYWRVDHFQVLAPVDPIPAQHLEGWTYQTGNTAPGKHWERIFFNANIQGNNIVNDTPRALAPSTAIGRQLWIDWKQLIVDAKAANERALRPNAAGGHLAPGPQENLSFAPHILDPRRAELSTGDLCYAVLNGNGANATVTALLPVQISRRLGDLAPEAFLADDLKPITAESDLASHSPADRVFGTTQVRGAVRIGRCSCITEPGAAVTTLRAGVSLAILSFPKPSQARFYLGRRAGAAVQSQDGGGSKEERGYRDPKTRALRGRKVYVHHASIEPEHWDPTGNREYKRPSNHQHPATDDQNRTITEWVSPGASFQFVLEIDGLTAVELGALLWLLELGPDHHLRFGYAKPLGFGSVVTSILRDDSWLSTGAAMRDAFVGLTSPPADAPFDPAPLVDAFATQLGEDELVEIARAFRRAARGHETGLPVHYPRRQPDPHPDQPSYKWFVENERVQNNAVVHGNALPDLTSDGGLPRF